MLVGSGVFVLGLLVFTSSQWDQRVVFMLLKGNSVLSTYFSCWDISVTRGYHKGNTTLSLVEL